MEHIPVLSEPTSPIVHAESRQTERPNEIMLCTAYEQGRDGTFPYCRNLLPISCMQNQDRQRENQTKLCYARMGKAAMGHNMRRKDTIFKESMVQSVQTWSPYAIGTTAGATGQAQCISDAPESPAGPTSVDAPANGVDAVSAAFLQLVEFQGRNQFSKPAPELLRVLLSNGCLAADELLGVVDWERLRNLAEKSLSRAFTPPVPSRRIDHSDSGVEPLSRFPWDDVLSVPSSWTASSSLLTPGPSTLVDPAAYSSELGDHPSAEHELSLSNTPHASHSPGVSRRRCSNCGVDHTTQWRRHPETSDYLCNRCGQHQRRYGRARSLQVISRGTRRARANQYLSDGNTKCGGDVILRRVQKA
ncbi:hypothetical protein C8R45DRAFT_927914 [Mycena sanguinolenta]|nr:hypothetical protein C8R45DRAFT_927914 [Mycena sanguinolenta]